MVEYDLLLNSKCQFEFILRPAKNYGILAKQDPRQGQAGKSSKSRKKLLATAYHLFFPISVNVNAMQHR